MPAEVYVASKMQASNQLWRINLSPTINQALSPVPKNFRRAKMWVNRLINNHSVAQGDTETWMQI